MSILRCRHKMPCCLSSFSWTSCTELPCSQHNKGMRSLPNNCWFNTIDAYMSGNTYCSKKKYGPKVWIWPQTITDEDQGGHLIEADQGKGIELLQSDAALLGQLMVTWHNEHQLIVCIRCHLEIQKTPGVIQSILPSLCCLTTHCKHPPLMQGLPRGAGLQNSY